MQLQGEETKEQTSLLLFPPIDPNRSWINAISISSKASSVAACEDK